MDNFNVVDFPYDQFRHEDPAVVTGFLLRRLAMVEIQLAIALAALGQIGMNPAKFDERVADEFPKIVASMTTDWRNYLRELAEPSH